MSTSRKWIIVSAALILALAALALFAAPIASAVIGGAAEAAIALEDNHGASVSKAACGGRLEELYACRYGDWRPGLSTGVGVMPAEQPNCGGLRLDEFYACRYGNWRSGSSRAR